MGLIRSAPYVALLFASLCAAGEIGFDTSKQPSRPALGGHETPAPPTPGSRRGDPHPTSADPIVLPTATPTITMSLGFAYQGFTPMGIGFHPAFNQYYSAMGGNPGYSGLVWNSAGGLLQTLTPINVDVRGVNYNPNTNAIEIVSYAAAYGFEGLLQMGLTSSGLYTGINNVVLGILPGLAGDQTMPAYDPGRNLLYSRSEDAAVNIVSRATGALMGQVTLDLSSVGIFQLLGEAIGYDADLDVLITVDLFGDRALVHRMDGSFLGACALPGFLPTQDRFNMGYAHGQLFVFDANSNAWHGYKILAPGVVHHTITASAGLHGSINPSGAVSVQDGGSQAFTISPDPLYRVQDVLVDGGSIGPTGSYTFSNVIADHTIAASFAPANHAPVCDSAYAVPGILWPPNHGLVPIRIAGVSDPDGDRLTLTVTSVLQDESVSEAGGDDTCPDGVIADGQAQVRAERSGSGNGRVYTIGFHADDGHGGACDGSVTVCVPHDQGDTNAEQGGARSRHSRLPDEVNCTGIDSGNRFNSLACSQRRAALAPGDGEWTMTAGPSNGASATLEFNLPKASDVVLTLFDVGGRQVAELYRGRQEAGAHTVQWDTGNLRSGMYYYRLQAGQSVLTRPFLNLR